MSKFFPGSSVFYGANCIENHESADSADCSLARCTVDLNLVTGSFRLCQTGRFEKALKSDPSGLAAY